MSSQIVENAVSVKIIIIYYFSGYLSPPAVQNKAVFNLHNSDTHKTTVQKTNFSDVHCKIAGL